MFPTQDNEENCITKIRISKQAFNQENKQFIQKKLSVNLNSGPYLKP